MLRKLRERKEFRDVLQRIYDTPDGKLFFSYFLRHCHITRSQFENDPYRIVEQESLRRLAMSYLHILGRSDSDLLLEELQAEFDQHQQK